jgi:hypothetical protein
MNAELCNCGAFYGLVTVTMTVGGNTVRAVCQVLVSVTRTGNIVIIIMLNILDIY